MKHLLSVYALLETRVAFAHHDGTGAPDTAGVEPDSFPIVLTSVVVIGVGVFLWIIFSKPKK